MTSTAIPIRRVSLRRTLSDTGTITRRNLRHSVRVPQLLVFSTIQPVTFMLLFTYVFGGALLLALPSAAAGSYVNWLIPGLLAQYGLFSGGQTAAGLAEDMSKGVIDRFRSLPMARSAVLAGRTVSDLVRTAFILVLLVGVGFLIGFRPQTSLLAVLAALLVALAFGFAWSWVMVVLGLLVRTSEAVQAAGYLVLFPLAFASSVFVPTQTMPTWLQWFTAHQPVTAVTNALRGLILGEAALPGDQTVGAQVVLALLWSAAIIAVFIPISVRIYRRAAK
ncbi:MAG: ABC transporter permease [Acidimicrobiia bacterium]